MDKTTNPESQETGKLSTVNPVASLLPESFKELTKEEEIALVQGLYVKKDMWDREFDWTYLDYARILKDRLNNAGFKTRMMLCKMRSVSIIYFYVETPDGPKHYAARSISDKTDGASADLTKILRLSPVKRELSGGIKKPYPRLSVESEIWFLTQTEIGDQVKVSVYLNSANQGDWQIIITPDEGLT